MAAVFNESKNPERIGFIESDNDVRKWHCQDMHAQIHTSRDDGPRELEMRPIRLQTSNISYVRESA
jgi:hypothetical protein